jgi:hypothetical protein
VKFSDYILLLSAAIVVIGWFVNSYLNRRHEITKKRIDHRLDTLKNYISFYIEAQKSNSLDGFNDIQVSFYLYGYKTIRHGVKSFIAYVPVILALFLVYSLLRYSTPSLI